MTCEGSRAPVTLCPHFCSVLKPCWFRLLTPSSLSLVPTATATAQTLVLSPHGLAHASLLPCSVCPPPPPPGSAHLSAPVQTRWHHVRAVPVRPWFTLVPSPPSFTCPVGLLRVLTPPPLPACPHILTSSRPHVCRSLGPGALLLHLLHPVPGPGGAAPLPRRLWVPPPPLWASLGVGCPSLPEAEPHAGYLRPGAPCPGALSVWSAAFRI